MPFPNLKKFNFKVGDENLAAIKIQKDEQDVPSFLFLHGGGVSNKYRMLHLAEPLLEHGISTLAFDHSGSGESSGSIKQASLKKRYDEATEAIKFLSKDQPLTVCGTSMGGYISQKLLDSHDIQNLILFCPAAYDLRAFDIQFGSGFTEIIREEGSWRNSDTYSLLSEFEGNLLVFIGEEDSIIPTGVIDLLDKHSSKATKKEIVRIPNCGHAIPDWIQEDKANTQMVLTKILEFTR